MLPLWWGSYFLIFPECHVRVKEVELSRIRAVQQISYLEVVKSVEGARGHSSEEHMVVDAPQLVAIVFLQSSDLDTLIVKKVDFVTFIATVINYTAHVSKKSKKLDLIIYAQEKFWASKT